MSKAQATKQPSIEDLLASIRQAIHDDVAPAGKPGPQESDRSAAGRREPAASASGSLHTTAAARVAGADPAMAARSAASTASAAPGEAAQGTAMKRSIVTADREGFAGLLGGDVRLEEALARLSHAGRRTAAASQPAAPVQQPAQPPQPAPRLRPAIDEPVTRFRAQAPSHELAENGSDGARDALRPPWLRPEAPATAAPVETADDDMHPETDPLWDDGPHRSGHQPFASPPESEEPECPGHTVGRDLLSADAAAAASSAFNKLAGAIVQRSTGGDRSLEDVTRELLRPMLKNWLDENLPSMVERLVREEIERVARKGK